MKQAVSRRQFGAALASAGVLSAQSDRPNILWITCEDTGPHLGCYGDKYARTPNLDALAARGARYRMAWSNAPVCAPARTAIIAGMYPNSTGGEHMRSQVRMPEGMTMYPCHLREAGYYVTNNAKEDYNLEHTGKVWNESSPRAHWRKRATGQPFFSIFNFITTHESQIRKRPHKAVSDPAKVRVPAYHPDTPEVRQDWAQYYDNIATMDGQAGEVLKQLEQDGLSDSTIVFFYGDHGAGMPRGKRWPYNSGLQVPLIVYVPEKWKALAPEGYAPGGQIGRLVSFVDLAPTLLSIVGVKPPEYMQGRSFMGRHTAAAPEYLFGLRGRMDERVDCVRSATDGRYVYLRHFMPHRIYGQHIAYLWEMPTTQVWKKQFDDRKLNGAQQAFWKEKPSEELYDLQTDPDEINNLAASPKHRDTLLRMRKAVHDWMLSIRDVGILPEGDMLARSGAALAPYAMAKDRKQYPIADVLRVAEMASLRAPGAAPELARSLGHSDPAVRFWAATGLRILGASAVASHSESLRKTLSDTAPAPRIAAAEALGLYSPEKDLSAALDVLAELSAAGKHGAATAILAMNALTALGDKGRPALDRIREADMKDTRSPERLREYPARLKKSLLEPAN